MYKPTLGSAQVHIAAKWLTDDLVQNPTEVLDEYGADALRLYLINSPVVRGETLRFKKEGVFAVVKDVFLPWYNAYRFLVQNVLRLQQQTGITFEPTKVDFAGYIALHLAPCMVVSRARVLCSGFGTRVACAVSLFDWSPAACWHTRFCRCPHASDSQ